MSVFGLCQFSIRSVQFIKGVGTWYLYMVSLSVIRFNTGFYDGTSESVGFGRFNGLYILRR